MLGRVSIIFLLMFDFDASWISDAALYYERLQASVNGLICGGSYANDSDILDSRHFSMLIIEKT